MLLHEQWEWAWEDILSDVWKMLFAILSVGLFAFELFDLWLDVNSQE